MSDVAAAGATGGDNGAAAAAAAAATGGTQGGDAGAGAFTVPKEQSDWALTKGYKDFEKKAAADPEFYRIAKSYYETEKYVGADKIIIPKQDDPRAMEEAYKKLGRPEKAEDYKIPLPEGMTDSPLAKEMSKTFLEAGLNQPQAEKIASAWNTYEKGIIDTYQADVAARAATDKATLEKEWGGNFKANTEAAQRGFADIAKHAGMEPGDIDLLESTIGLQKTMKMLSRYADALQLKGDTFEGGGAGERVGSSMTVARAQAQKDALMNDKGWYEKYRAGDVEAKQKLAKLNQIIAPTRE